ncbi:MAG TPA: hypothetical protein VMU12_00875 [Candidatus Paceibacterota bacterium]|nr:hypothetical protein [Candidatus Paceibacterota bacterium]
MNGVLVAALLVIVLVAGVYIGISGIATQYAFGTSRSSAANVLCSPDVQTASVGQTVRFALAGMAAGTAYHWASDEGTMKVQPDGRLSVIYSTTGIKNAWAFILTGTTWSQVRCSVTVR